MQTASTRETDPTCCGSTLWSLGLAVTVHAAGLAVLFVIWLMLPMRPQAAATTSHPPARADDRGSPGTAANLVRLVSEEVATVTAGGAATPSEDPRLSLLQGVWRDYYRGERTLTLNSDGTGLMVVVLAGFAKKMFAERLSFEVEWTLAGDQLVMETRSGKPDSKFQLIRKLYGDRAEYQLLSLDRDLMRWRDAGGKTEYEWSRWEADSP